MILPCFTSFATNDAKRVSKVPQKDRVTEYVLTSQSNACWKSYEFVPEKESNRVSASGLSALKCTMRFKDLDLAVLRINQQLNSGEQLRLKGRSFDFTILSNSSQYKCYVLDSNQPIDIIYTKPSNVKPALDFMLTEAKSHQGKQQPKDYDVSCLVDGCTLSNPSINLHYVYIDGDWECDSYQQCPYGEDERCGSIPTNTPETDRTTIPPGTSIRPTYPPHITPILISPDASYCFPDGSTLYNFGEYILTSHIDRQWSGRCSLSFADRGTDDHDQLTLLTFRGKLSDGERLTISDKSNTFLFDGSAYDNECVTAQGTFKVVYSTDNTLTSGWNLLIAPINSEYPSKGSLSGGAIAGIVIAVILAAAAISVVAFIFVKKRRSGKVQAATSIRPVPPRAVKVSDFPGIPYVHSKTKDEANVQTDNTAENTYEVTEEPATLDI